MVRPASKAISLLSSSCRSLMDMAGNKFRQKDDAADPVIKVQAFPGSKAIPAADEYAKFPVLVRVTAARTTTTRIGVDVVAVLDVSSSMDGEKLEELKKAMESFIDKLGAEDRLSIVSFSSEARRLTGLTSMSVEGRDDAKDKVNALEVSSGTNMGVALIEGAKVLREREAADKNNSVGCMMFLSDGRDKEIRKQNINNEFPVHTFGLGTDHDPKALKYIADKTYGTYSFVSQYTSKISDAFAFFIAGLTSVAATSIKITFKAHEGTTILSIESGGYVHLVGEHSGEIDIPNMYAAEQKNFIVYLKVMAKGKDNLMTSFLKDRGMACLEKQKIITVGCLYHILDTRSELASREVTVLRPRGESSGKPAIDPEVAAELTRIGLEKSILAMVEQDDQEQPTGDEPTSDRLQLLWDRIKDSDNGATPNKTLLKLGNDVAEMKKRLESPDADKSGLPYILSWLSCNNWQRATTKDAPPDTDAFQCDADADTMTREKTILHSCCLHPSRPMLVVVSLLFLLAVMLYFGGYGGGLKPATTENTTALDLSGHPGWPEMEQDLEVMIRKTGDVQITSYFREASVEDMNLQMDRYLYLAIVHATVLRRRSVGSSISDKLAVRREAESYIQVMLMRMKNIDIPSFQGTSAEFITYEMNRYLYSTIVQASVLRGSYSHEDGTDELPGPMINIPTPVNDVPTPGTFINDSELIKETTTEVVQITELEEQKETLVVRIAELELELQSRETLVVKIAEMERALQQRETLVVSLRSELEMQRESCAQRAAKVQTQLKTCAQMADKWKAKVVAMGGRADDEDYKY